MGSSIYTIQIKDVLNVNGKRIFVWSISFMSFIKREKIEAENVIGQKYDLVIDAMYIDTTVEKIKVKTITGELVEVPSLESLFING